MDKCMLRPPEELSEEEINTILESLTHREAELRKKFRWFSYAVNNDPMISVDKDDGILQFDFELGDGTQSNFSVSVDRNITKFDTTYLNCTLVDACFNISNENVNILYSVGGIDEERSIDTENTYLNVTFDARKGEKTNSCVSYHRGDRHSARHHTYLLYSSKE